MNWFAKNGDKLLSLLTATALLLTASGEAAQLGLNQLVVNWVSFGGAVLTAAHTLYFPNTQVVTK
jgi:hypothetical protein